MPVKYKDPGCPTIACKSGDNQAERALLDLGANVNLLRIQSMFNWEWET